MKVKWTPELVNELADLRGQGLKYRIIADIMSDRLNADLDKDIVRLAITNHSEWLYKNVEEAIDVDSPVTINKLSDGSYSSSRTLNLSDSELKDESKLLEYHGYDPEKWEIKTSSNSRNTRETNKGTKHSYNSRITVKPKQSLTLDDLKEELTKTYVEPMVVYKNKPVDSESTLVIPLFDLHFGITTKDTIQNNLNKLLTRIEHGYDEIVIVSGGDVMHSDVVIGNTKTTSGTLLDPADMKTAIQDARSFYDTIFRASLANSNNVEHYAIGGNHDRTTSYMFYLVLKERFPQVEHHLDDYRLAFKVGNTGILVAHGDTAMKDIALLFATQYSEVWNATSNHEIYSGHFHTKNTTDEKGVILRSFGTPKNPDGYEVKNGYLGNRKISEAIEYDKDTVVAEYFL